MGDTRLLALDVQTARVNADADGDNTIVAAVAGKRIRVVGYALSATTAGLVTIRSAATVLAELSLPAAGTVVPYVGSVAVPAFQTAPGEALVFATQVGQDVNGHLAYHLL
jgi:hypothetical protein